MRGECRFCRTGGGREPRGLHGRLDHRCVAYRGPDGSFLASLYINRGISGQTTPQMVLRFPQDVIALKPKVVVILAGINDIAGNTGDRNAGTD